MAEIQIRRINRRVAQVPVVGTAPLIVHRFDEKAKQMMLDTQQGRKRPKAHRDPQQDFENALHRLPNGDYGFPATGFKASMVGGARYFQDKKLSMTLLKQALFVLGDGPDMLVPIESAEPKMREDTVRIGAGTSDLRYRPMFDPWSAVVQVVYLPSLMDLESIVALVDAGGLGGIGEWRPSAPKSATGVYGTFEVDESREVTEVSLDRVRPKSPAKPKRVTTKRTA